MEKVLVELQELIEYRDRYFAQGKSPKILALGLSSRKNLCIHPQVMEEGARESVDAKCMRLTAPWVRERAAVDPESAEVCDWFEGLEAAGPEGRLSAGVYTLHDLRSVGRKKRWCPYFLARHMIAFANVVVFSYQYMLDPKVSTMVSREMEKEAVVVFDEAHNIDNVCIEALSVDLRQQTLDGAGRNLSALRREIDRVKETDAERLKEEYRRLISGLATQGLLPTQGRVGGGGNDSNSNANEASTSAAGPETDSRIETVQWLANPALPDDVLREAVPGNIRRAEHFVAFLQRFLGFLRRRLTVRAVMHETPTTFLASLQEEVAIDAKTLKFCYDRLVSLMKTLEISANDEYHAVHLLADFATLVATYARGFAVITEPFDDRQPNIPDPVIHLSCLDASLAMQPVFTKFQTVVITSGTLSPIDLYPRILNFHPVAIQSLNMTLTRDCLCPVVVTRGADQTAVSTKFDMRSDPGVIRNYGKLLVELAAAVPDGIVCFFVSYHYMDSIVSRWHEMGILQELMAHKLVFIETQDVIETTLALDNYRRACDCGRGAVFLSVARGKVAEGIDFDRHYGRCVVMFGVPYQYTLSRILRARLEYLRETFQIKESDYLAFDAVRQAAQCVGRVIRSKADYGLMVFADKRYQRGDKRDKLPRWITSHLEDTHLNLSTDMLVSIARDFMGSMAQPYDRGIEGMGKSLLSLDAVEALERARTDAAAAAGVHGVNGGG